MARTVGIGKQDFEKIRKTNCFYIDKTSFILEFKVYDQDEERSLEETVKSALEQIEREKYAAGLIAEGIPEKNIRKYGFAFEGKKVLIGS